MYLCCKIVIITGESTGLFVDGMPQPEPQEELFLEYWGEGQCS